MRFDKVLGVRHTYWELGHRFGSYFPFTTRTVEYRISNPSYHGVRYFQSLVPWSAVFPIPRTSNPSYRGVQRTFSNPGYKHLLTLFLLFFFLFSFFYTQETYEKLKTENPDSFVAMTQTVDEDEHSLEMHLPYIARVFGNSDSRAVPPLVPILVGALSSKNEKKMGSILAPFLDDPCNLFIVSSDFCHWGKRFSYTRWAGQDGGVPLHTAIERLDKEGIEHIVNKDADGFCAYIERTKSTICGRHPIGVLLRALELSQNFSDRHVELLRYEQSSQAVTRSDSSVSYASAVVY